MIRRPGPPPLVVALAAACLLPAASLAAQQAGPVRAAARVSPDTVRVGEPFTIGVVATGSEDVRFPPLLEPGEGWEQLDIARVEDGGGETRAYYRLVAWQAGELELPDLLLRSGADDDRTGGARISLPAPQVRSVLPAGEDAPELRGPRGPQEPAFPWLLVLALVALLAGIAWWWRRRVLARRSAAAVAADEPAPAEHPSERARRALVALRAEAESGAIPSPVFYDRLEGILRDYLGETRAWPPTRPVRGAPELLRGQMLQLHRHAVASRFGGVDAAGHRLLDDADTSITWLEGDAA